MKAIGTMAGRALVLTISLYVIMALASLFAGLNSANTQEPAKTALILLLVCLAFALVTSYPVYRSKWSGLPLILTMFWVVFGIMTLLTQVETVVFLEHLVDIIPPEIVPKLFLQGLIIAGLYAPLLVLVHRKLHKSDHPQPATQEYHLPSTVREWLWRVGLIAIAYIAIYIIFGLTVFSPLAGDAFAQYYHDLQMPVWILPFQALRALIWVAIAVPVILMFQGPRWEASLAVALLFSVLMGFLLLLPNDFMPAQIRLAHFVEVCSSNFLFGWLVVSLLTKTTPSA